MNINFNEQQKQLIQSTAQYTIGVSRAGSGKTSCIVERVKFLHEERQIPYEKMVVITYTNAMTEELMKRLGRPRNLKIYTVHGYCNYLLLSSGITTFELLDKEKFDELFEVIKQHPEAVQPVTHLLLDEANDSTTTQFEFILNVIKPKEWTFVGDPAQEIYDFNKDHDDTFIKLIHDDKVTTYYINTNYRNGRSILYFAKRFLYYLGEDYRDNSIPFRTVNGTVDEIACTQEEAIEELLRIKDKYHTTWGDWFILCRKNSEITQFQDLLKAKKIPTDTFKQSEVENDQLENRLKEDSIKILTAHSSKGLENKCVLSYNIMGYNNSESRLCYVAATRARDHLIWAHMPSKRKKKKTKVVNWE